MNTEIPIFRSLADKEQFMAAYDAVMLHWPVAYEDLIVKTRFGSTHIVASGPVDAHPIILLPPGGGYAPIWIRNVGSLSQIHRVYVVDIIGELNKSIPIKPIRTSPDFTDWMEDLLDGLRINKTHLIGNSNGGFYALQTVLSLPNRIEKVVLISPAATFVQMWAWWLHLLIPAHILAPILKNEQMIFRSYDWLWQGFPMDDDYARLRKISKVAGNGYRPTINSFSPSVFTDAQLRRVDHPTLLMIGDHEVIYSPDKVIHRASGLIPGLQTEIIPNANHSAQYTAPDAVNRSVLKFLVD
jgi:pimeloyl-ACP methyl ester carboxylesterase